jgi:hypothetical protein
MRPGPEATDHRVQMLNGMPVLILGDLGGNISILWGDIVGPCQKKKVHMKTCLVVNSYQGRAVWIHICRNVVNGNRDISVSLFLILIKRLNDFLHRNFQFFLTAHNKCSKIPPSTLVHFATPVRRSRVVSLSWSSRFFMLAAASKMRANNSFRVSTFSCVNLALHSTAQTEI